MSLTWNIPVMVQADSLRDLEGSADAGILTKIPIGATCSGIWITCGDKKDDRKREMSEELD